MTTTKQIAPIDQIRNSLKLLEPQFKSALPSHIQAERFIRVAQTAISNNPNLINADRTSLFSACMSLAQQGLIPDGREASLVCFGSKVTPMPQITGILKKIRNSGELLTILAEQVFENDVFEYWIDEKGQNINHKPLIFGDRGKQLGVYAIATTKDGGVYVEVMSMSDIESVKKTSKSANSGPWVSFPGEMQKKTVIRRLSKRLPMSTDVDQVLINDDDTYEMPQAETEAQAVQQEQPKKRKSRLETVVDVEAEPPQLKTDDVIPI